MGEHLFETKLPCRLHHWSGHGLVYRPASILEDKPHKLFLFGMTGDDMKRQR